ncbi:MAG: UbiX family flavin prenyltransferase [Nitrospirota bacterium]|nr:UbiX family flavin prenyltransferase [Nitrospirota bacterium]
MKKYIFAITGASGPVVGIRALKKLAEVAEVHILISSQSFSIIKFESGIDWSGEKEMDIQRKIREYFGSDNVYYHGENNMAAPVSSGSFKTDGMFVAPCSMKSLSGIANGYANSLIERAADVTIKEGRPLVISPREMPFSAIHLENMLRLARMGVKIAPPVPGFYHRPENINDLVDFMAGKLIDAMGVEHNIYKRWS